MPGRYAAFWASVLNSAIGIAPITAVESGGTGDADLYLRKGSAPTVTSFDCASEKFKLPVRATGNVEYAKWSTAAIDNKSPLVVNDGGFR